MTEAWLQAWLVIAQVAIPFVAAAIVLFVKDQAGHLAARAKTARVRDYAHFVAQLVTVAVAATNNTYVDALKLANADGKLTSDEAKQAFTTTKLAVKAMLTEAERKVAAKLIGDLETLINALIEQQVRQMGVETVPVAGF